MTDFYKRIINGRFPEPAGASDYWDMIRESNPDVFNIVKEQAENMNVVLTAGQMLNIAGCIVSALTSSATSGQTLNIGQRYGVPAIFTMIRYAGSNAISEIALPQGDYNIRSEQ